MRHHARPTVTQSPVVAATPAESASEQPSAEAERTLPAPRGSVARQGLAAPPADAAGSKTDCTDHRGVSSPPASDVPDVAVADPTPPARRT